MSPTAPGSLRKQEHPRVAFAWLPLLRQATLSLDVSGCERWDRLSLGELLWQPNLTGITPFTRLEKTLAPWGKTCRGAGWGLPER